MSIPALLLSMKTHLLDLLFPIECIGCGSDNQWLCDACVKKIELNNDFFCPFCGHFSFQGHTCFTCARNMKLGGAWVLGKYNSIMRACITAMKYSYIEQIGAILGLRMSSFFERFGHTNDFDIIMPVPLHSRRLLYRGFNQSLALAQKISEHFSIPLDDETLIRKKFTKPQVHYNRDKRLANIKDAFRVEDGDKILGKKILLIDDVMTTGSTLEGCASALIGAGAKSVWGFVLAKR